MRININQLFSLSNRQSRAEYLTEKYGDMWNLPKFDGYRNYNKNKDPYWLASRIIDNNIGKSFSLAFHYYCKKVKKHHQHIFLDKFNNHRSYRIQEYFIDDNGNIVHKPYYYSWMHKKTPVLYSIDYKTEKRYKGIGSKVPDFYYSFYKHGRKEEDYVEVVISGFKKEFESKNCKEYKRFYNDNLKKKNKIKREERKEKRERAYNFLTQSELKQKSINKAENLLKIQRKGFDIKTSFRND